MTAGWERCCTSMQGKLGSPGWAQQLGSVTQHCAAWETGGLQEPSQSSWNCKLPFVPVSGLLSLPLLPQGHLSVYRTHLKPSCYHVEILNYAFKDLIPPQMFIFSGHRMVMFNPLQRGNGRMGEVGRTCFQNWSAFL